MHLIHSIELLLGACLPFVQHPCVVFETFIPQVDLAFEQSPPFFVEVTTVKIEFSVDKGAHARNLMMRINDERQA
ncbi:hypothetical protein [Pararobbsia alpina]|uniref:hypothetical protein n=1 Tax=Pararobbsia alpina TaxID=621374 RepID=UPI0039A4A627